jgi:hypothetical protein
MSPAPRLKPTEWLLEWSLGELQAAQKALGYFARHDGRCPVGQRAASRAAVVWTAPKPASAMRCGPRKTCGPN